MELKLQYTLAVLLALTLVTALFAQMELPFGDLLILALALLKFYGVAFYFMDLRRAHPFWQVAIVVFGLLVLSILSLLIG
ncbi:MAG: hypothetical protein CMC08_05955 [Flavobacteriaceae bacterium]|nr:hypothetical protein [Flavobacteriaceae bacterium]|tara:strand:+ start:209 stop:448 length:240 start_codon:yes stop_codon:yes gene_type:complete